MKKLTFEYVKQYFESQGCKLIEKEYINNRTDMRYLCKNDHLCKVNFGAFKFGRGCAKCTGNKKHIFEDVQKYFKEHGCKLLATEYKNNSTPMKYECKCGNKECKISFANFKKGERCIECSGCKKHTYEYIKQYFEDHDCELKEKEYINCKTLMKYRCDCGNDKWKITFNNFKYGQRCPECRGGIRLTFEYVYNYFKEHNCELLETEYKNSKTKMKYRCDCGNPNICKITFKKFKIGQRCRECMKRKIAEKNRYTLKEVQKIFKDGGCKLLEKVYINNRTSMKFRCECKRKGKITLASFSNGSRCHKCAIERVSGENNYNWNPNLTDEEREKNRRRNSPEDVKWRKDIYKKNDFTCQCCFKKGAKLNAHHIKNYSSNEELRTVISNGITLCEKHHKEFHKIYGKKNNNLFQLNEFFVI